LLIKAGMISAIHEVGTEALTDGFARWCSTWSFDKVEGCEPIGGRLGPKLKCGAEKRGSRLNATQLDCDL